MGNSTGAELSKTEHSAVLRRKVDLRARNAQQQAAGTTFNHLRVLQAPAFEEKQMQPSLWASRMIVLRVMRSSSVAKSGESRSFSNFWRQSVVQDSVSGVRYVQFGWQTSRLAY